MNKVPDALVVQDDSVVRGDDLCHEEVIDVLTIFSGFVGVSRKEEGEEEPSSVPCCRPFSRC